MLHSKGQLCWRPLMGKNETKVLHLRCSPDDPWRVYTAMPEYAVPDYRIPRGSKGWATYQKLRGLGWELLPDEEFSKLSCSS